MTRGELRPAKKPRHAARATREAGREMRSRLLDAASALFKERGLSAVSVGEVAAAADAFPSQITYYFRSKEALFVEAACRDILYAGSAAEVAAADARTPAEYTRALVESVMGADALGFFIEALTLTRRRQDLAPLIERTIKRLHAEGVRAYAGQMQAHGWRSRAEPAISARGFWATALGVALEGRATGRSDKELAAEMLRLINVQADPNPQEPRLKLVAGGSSRNPLDPETSS